VSATANSVAGSYSVIATSPPRRQPRARRVRV
jgi:hypothetical protein